MIKSMTGFGRAEVADASRKFTVEIKSVNHRYLDVNIKLPKTLNFFESAIRSLLKEYIERGKVDVFISYEDYTEENYSLKYNAGLAEQYMTYLKEMAEQFGIENDVRVSTLSRYPDVFVMEEQSRMSRSFGRDWSRRSARRQCSLWRAVSKRESVSGRISWRSLTA